MIGSYVTKVTRGSGVEDAMHFGIILSTNKGFAMKLFGFAAIMLCPLWSLGQTVHTVPVKGGVVLSVFAQKPYSMMPGEQKLPQMGVECTHKGKKASHMVIFSPGGSVVADDAEGGAKAGQNFDMTIDGNKQATTWTSYGDTGTFAYSAKTEPERLQFMHTLLNSNTVSIEFKPFLTGTSTTSVFDLSGLRDAVQKRPDCAQ